MNVLRNIIGQVGIIAIAVAIIITPSVSFAASRTRGYVRRSTGAYVQPYYHSTRNYTRLDNYSTRGNINPYTGKKGYTSPFKSFRVR